MPLISPHANTIPLLAPSDKLLVIKYRMSGPGANVNSTDAVTKYITVVVSKFITSVLKSFYSFRCADANILGDDTVKAIVNGRVIVPCHEGNFVAKNRWCIIFDDRIRAIGSMPKDNDELDAYEFYDDNVLRKANVPDDAIDADAFNDVSDADVIDAGGMFVAPGFINVHIHGCAGADVMDASPAALSTIRNYLPSTGVTSFLPTTMTMPLINIYAALKNIRRAMKFNEGAKILGANLEGPFISEKFCGAQDKKNILRADFNLIEPFADVLKIITVAPEELSALSFISECRSRGIIVSIGHSAADCQTVMNAFAYGARNITHLFNAQTGLHHRRPGIVGAALASHAVVELIADNVHIDPVVQKIVSKAKPSAEIILITDSLRACGCGDGVFDLGGQRVTVKGTLATLDDGTIAASVAPMNEVVKNFWLNSGWAIENVIESVTKTPAVELEIYDRLGSLEVGKAADIVIFDDALDIHSVFVDGEPIL